MMIYNTTFHVDSSIHDECLDFFRNEYIPFVLKTPDITSPRICMVLSEHTIDGYTYSLQFSAPTKEVWDLWLNESEPTIRQAMASKFGDKAIGFSVFLEEIDL